MRVELRFFAGLRAYLPDGQSAFGADLAAGATVADVLRAYGIPEEVPRIVLVNGRHATLEQALAEGDTLSLFPPVAGG